MENKNLGNVIELRPERIRPFADQPRKFFDEVALKRLERSIASAGQQNPVIVKPLPGNRAHDFELVDGQRRWHACKRLGVPIRAIVRTDLNDPDKQFLVSVVSNFSREEHTPMETAHAIARIRTMPQIVKLDRTKQSEAIGALFGHSQVWVYQYESLLRLAPELQKRVDPQHPDPLSFRVAVQMASLPLERQRDAAQRVASQNLGREAAVAFMRRLSGQEGVKADGKAKAGILRDDKVLLTALLKLEQLIMDGGLNITAAFRTRAQERELALNKIDSLVSELADLRDQIEVSAAVPAPEDEPEPAPVSAPAPKPTPKAPKAAASGSRVRWDEKLGQMVCVDQAGAVVESNAPAFKPQRDGLR